MIRLFHLAWINLVESVRKLYLARITSGSHWSAVSAIRLLLEIHFMLSSISETSKSNARCGLHAKSIAKMSNYCTIKLTSSLSSESNQKPIQLTATGTGSNASSQKVSNTNTITTAQILNKECTPKLLSTTWKNF